jgi:YHS domain-containing protein
MTEVAMTTDPVCHMEFDEKTAKATATYEGRTYFFCSHTCKATFEQNPQKYASQPATVK